MAPATPSWPATPPVRSGTRCGRGSRTIDPAYLEYERRTTREIPVVVLEPVPEPRPQGTV